MTKKHFIKFADMMVDLYDKLTTSEWETVLKEVARTCGQCSDGGRFDDDKFMNYVRKRVNKD